MSMPETAARQRRIGNPAATVPETLAGSDFFSTNYPGRPRVGPFLALSSGPKEPNCMPNLTLIYPMAAMVLLTVFVLVRLFRSRVAAVRTGQVEASYFRLYVGDEPETTRKVSRHFSNLFEAPTLFYIACLAGMVAGVAGPVFLVCAWGYVGARGIHAVVHLGGNRLRKRIVAYFASWVFLVAMWITLVVVVARR
jgi:hypothetical protein